MALVSRDDTQRYAELHMDLERLLIAIDQAAKALIPAVNELNGSYNRDEERRSAGERAIHRPHFDVAARAAMNAATIMCLNSLDSLAKSVAANQAHVENVCPSIRQAGAPN